MRIAGWFIDRWRKSTAYTDMTAQEQGLYRNLIDEVYLREDGVIPDASMAKASGDPLAWMTSSERVLCWMQKVPGRGWTNDTAMELKRFSEKKSDLGRAGGKASAEARAQAKGQPEGQPNGNGRANGTAKPDTDTVSVQDSVSVKDSDTDKGNGVEKPADLSARVSGLTPGGSCRPRVVKPWNAEACDDWIAAYEGTAPGARITKALRAILRKVGMEAMRGGDPRWSAEMVVADVHLEHERAGWARVRPVWQAYLRDTNSRYASAEKFAQTFGALEKRGGQATGGGRMENTRRAFERFMKGGK